MSFCVRKAWHGFWFTERRGVIACVSCSTLRASERLDFATPDMASPPINDQDIVGYVVAYEREELSFPVYLVAGIACAFVAAGAVKDIPLLFLPGIAAAAYAFYNIPLTETGKPRLGAGQYGLFIEGLGLIKWSSIEKIDVLPVDVRGVACHDMMLTLRSTLAEALLVDWRDRPLLRRLMRLPWSLRKGNRVRIPLDIMDRPVAEVHQTFLRLWRYYRGR